MSELEQRIAQLEINVLRAQAELAEARLEAARASIPKPIVAGDFVALARRINARNLTGGEPLPHSSDDFFAALIDELRGIRRFMGLDLSGATKVGFPPRADGGR